MKLFLAFCLAVLLYGGFHAGRSYERYTNPPTVRIIIVPIETEAPTNDEHADVQLGLYHASNP